MAAALELEDVWWSYDRVRWVLSGVTLSVPAGEVVVVAGRSGSGKTTLMNVAAGLEPPVRGSVRVAGRDVARMDEQARHGLRLNDVGVVFQRFLLIPELTVEENVELPMRLAGRRDSDWRARRLIAAFGVSEQAKAFPATLSGGETQRVAIARSLANDPSVVLADEPTANLDEENAKRVLSALRRAADVSGAGVVVASHDPLARGVGDRVFTLAEGRLVEASGGPTSPRAVGGP